MKRTEKLFEIIKQIRRQAHQASQYNGEYQATLSLKAIDSLTLKLDALAVEIFKEGFDTALLGMRGWIDAVTFPTVLGQPHTTETPTTKGKIQ